MKWLFIIDPLEKLNKDTDTTYPIMVESYNRKIDVFAAEINNLFFENKAKVSARKINFKQIIKVYKEKIFHLDDFDLIFMRKDPPYDLAYHYATNILSFSRKITVNSAQCLRDFNEKLIALNFPQLGPKTIVSSNEKEVFDFIKKHNDFTVIKALDSFQGRIVEKVHFGNKNLKNTIRKFTLNGKLPVMVQEYLPNIIKGDKRILILGGKILGAVNRILVKGSFISNFGQGGSGHKTQITKKEKDIVKELAPFFKKNRIHFAGLDIIDGYLTEINITCPTGLQHINKLENKNLEKEVVDYFIKLIPNNA